LIVPQAASKARHRDLADGATGLEEGNSPLAASMRPWFSLMVERTSAGIDEVGDFFREPVLRRCRRSETGTA
jgi:hypothetical protein